MNTRNRFMASVSFMTDAAVATPAPAKAKTVAEDMDARRIFATVDEVAAYLNTCNESFSDFHTIPLAAPGVDEEGNFDPAIYTDGTEIMVSTLRRVGKGTTPGGVKAIVVAPVPKLETLMDSDEGKAWVQRIIHKELNHVAVRPLRDAEDVSIVVDQMPTTMGAFITSGREGSAGIMETFNDLYKQINATLASKAPIWAKARFIKSDLKKAFESKGYAEEFFPAIENRGEGKDSLFVVALNLGIAAAKKKGLDPAIFQRWLDTRNNKAFNAADDQDEDDFDVSNLTDSLLADEAKADAPAADATA
jgi:hypothetical protein